MKKMISKKKKMILAAMLAGVMSLGVVGGNVSYAATPAKALASYSQMKQSSISNWIMIHGYLRLTRQSKPRM